MKKIFLSAIVLTSVGIFGASSAYAATPILTMTSTSGDSVQINVTGDPNAGVMFYYNIGSSSGLQVTTLGTTNSSGTFTTTISGSAYGVNPGASVYVLVNSQQSSMQAWPYNSIAVLGTPSLSQTNVPVGLGQTVVVTSQGNTTGVYLGQSPDSTVATIQINGTQINITGKQIGTTTATICYVGTASNCANLAITVQSANVQSLSFSQNNITITTGQSAAVNLYGGSGYYVSNNSNTSAIAPTVSGSILTLYGSANGSANITVCSASSGCGMIYVTVGASGANQTVSFGTSNPTVSVGQSTNIPVYGGASYYISSNSNSGAVQSNLNGSTITLYGVSAGSASILVCVSAGGCNTLYVTVTGTTGGIASNTSLLAEITAMQAQLAQILVSIQTMATKLTQLAASAGASASGGAAAVQSKYKFSSFLSVGSTGDEVTELQKRLIFEGHFTGTVTGYYGTATEAAVKKYQSAHGVTAAGYVGPSTRVILNGE